MLFLKQLDKDAREREPGQTAVVWEPSALRLIQEWDADKERMKNAEIKKTLQVKKRRPREIIPKYKENEVTFKEAGKEEEGKNEVMGDIPI